MDQGLVAVLLISLVFFKTGEIEKDEYRKDKNKNADKALLALALLLFPCTLRPLKCLKLYRIQSLDPVIELA